MPTSTVQDVIANLAQYSFNPVMGQRIIHQMIDDMSDGAITLVDATNPAVLCMQITAMQGAAIQTNMDVWHRRQYAGVSQTDDDLYLHMSDEDYLGRFALPTVTTFGLLISKTELLSRMVPDITTNSSKVVIPRNTYFSIAGVIFSMQYPIVISQLQHGGIQALYDVSEQSPLQTLATNEVTMDWSNDGVTEWLHLRIPVTQFSIISKQGATSLSKEFTLKVNFDDQYYYTRAYYQNADGVMWTEMATTHTDLVYDPTVPTAVLKVVGQQVSIRIPQVYTRTGLIGKKVRFDVYQTKGPLEMILEDYPVSSFGVTWKNYDPSDDTIYTAPMSNFRQLIPYSQETVTGGRDALSFTEQRTRVVNNATGKSVEVPISNVQLSSALEDLGYSVTANVDNITNRTLFATREMPEPTDVSLLTAAGACVETVSVLLDHITTLNTVIDNGTTITITPGLLFREVNGITSPVSDTELASVLALPPEDRALAVSNADYRYTPFYYVLDQSGTEFDLRAYYLDSPVAVQKTYTDDNPTTLLQVATDTYGVTKTATGYQVTIVTKSGASFQALDNADVHVQLAFIPQGEKDRAYVNGTFAGMSGTERVFTFDLSTNFSVDANDQLQLTKFFMFTQDARLTGVPLTCSFDILYSVSSVMPSQWISGAIDQALGGFLLPNQIAGVAQEALTLTFGTSLSALWAKTRSYSTGAAYQTYATAVPMVYQNDVYQQDSTGSYIQFDPTTGAPILTVLHKAGDPVLDPTTGLPLMQFNVGDIVTDAEGNPVPVSARSIQRTLDIFLIEGSYWFSNDATTVAYRTSLTEQVVNWIATDLAAFQKKVLEKTRIYFYPKATIGTMDVTVGDGVVQTISAAQSLIINLHVPTTVNNNDALKKQLTSSTITAMSAWLDNLTVAKKALNSVLEAQYGDDVVDFDVSGLGGDLNLTSLTVVDDTHRLSLRKNLVADPDNTLLTKEAVVFNWIVSDA